MDTITHLAVGACIGEVFLGRQLGRRALLWGAIAQSAPDIDWLASLWMSPAANLLAHRGFTHSFLFAAIITPLFALAADRWHRPHNVPFSRFMWFFAVSIFGHTLLDGLNSYGTGWFEPFNHARISMNVLFVADPFFTVGPVVATLALLLVRRNKQVHLKWAWGGLICCSLYLGYCATNKVTIDRTVERLLTQQRIDHRRTFITPTALNNWLWFVIADDGRGFHIGYRSVFDTSDSLELRYFPQNDELLADLQDHTELHLLQRFSQGYHTAELRHDTLLFNDLRFGQIMGWRDPHGAFTFHYFLQHPEDNRLVVQRGRFAGWDRGALESLIDRIRGR
jgi:inner membrane protein